MQIRTENGVEVESQYHRDTFGLGNAGNHREPFIWPQ
jgi:hypothetical protein